MLKFTSKIVSACNKFLNNFNKSYFVFWRWLILSFQCCNVFVGKKIDILIMNEANFFGGCKKSITLDALLNFNIENVQ